MPFAECFSFEECVAFCVITLAAFCLIAFIHWLDSRK